MLFYRLSKCHQRKASVLRQGQIKAENTTDATNKNVERFVFKLYEGEPVAYSKPIGPQKFALQNKRYSAHNLMITESKLSGVTTKSFDLRSNRYPAIIRRGNAIPLISSTKGAAQAKTNTFKSISSTIKPTP